MEKKNKYVCKYANLALVTPLTKKIDRKYLQYGPDKINVNNNKMYVYM